MFWQSGYKFLKTSKQCRERWLNHLDGNVKKEEMSTEEDLILLNFVMGNGSKWSQIVPLLHHRRTEHQIKNRFHSLVRRYKKNKDSPTAVGQLVEEIESKAKVHESKETKTIGAEEENGINFLGIFSSFQKYQPDNNS